MPTKYSFNCADARSAFSMSEWNPSRSIAKRWNSGMSASGRPISAAMTRTGIGMKTSSTRSARLASRSLSTVRSTSGWTSSASQRRIDERAKANSCSLR